MDYPHAHTSYFHGASQPFPFMGMQPLTPSATEDISTTSPPDLYERFSSGLNHDQFQSFEPFVAYHTQPSAAVVSSQSSFLGPPTPPNAHSAAVHAHHTSPPAGNDAALISISNTDVPPRPKTESSEDLSLGHRQGSNSEDDDLTPAQSRRKAQNRAAQRAFRERKERHVKDLESRLQELEAAQQQAATENEQLKKDLQKVNTENEILRATSSALHAGNGGGGSPTRHDQLENPKVTEPMTYQPIDFYTNLLQNHYNKTPSHRIVTDSRGDRLLAAGAAWDLITSHEMFKTGELDVQAVTDILKPHAQCDGQGPVFAERDILAAVEQVAKEGGDRL